MRIQYDVTEGNFEELAEKFKLLGNPKHLQIVLILEDKSLSLDEIHEQVKNKLYIHRESTYKALEKMVENDLIDKKYDKNLKKFYYTHSL
jgi:Fe2+ or Zn2+ uptake regulation protein